MADDEGVVAGTLGHHRVADHFSGAAEFDNRMGVVVVRRDALDIDFGTGIDDVGEMTPQPVPVNPAVLLVDIALIPDTNRVHRCFLDVR